MHMVTPASEACLVTVGHFAKRFDPGRKRQQLTEDFVTDLKNEFVSNDPNVAFSYVPFQDDNTQRPLELCSLELILLRNADLNDKGIIIADTRHTQRWSERKVDPTLCKGDIGFFCNCLVALENPASLGT